MNWVTHIIFHYLKYNLLLFPPLDFLLFALNFYTHKTFRVKISYYLIIKYLLNINYF